MPIPTLSQVWFWTFTTIFAGAGAYFGAYLKQKGKSLATKEDFDGLKEFGALPRFGVMPMTHQENLFAVGNGDLVISKAFTWSGPVAAIAAVGVARSAYVYVLKWAKTYTAGGDLPILHHQAVGYLLADVAMKIEACRAFSWKAAHYLDQFDSEGHAVGAMAKVFCGETLFTAVFRAMQAMGVNSLDKTHPMEKFLREAAVFPLYDAGNIGMQMRKIWGVMLDPEFDPRAIADTRPIEFKKSMEGVGTLGSALLPG